MKYNPRKIVLFNQSTEGCVDGACLCRHTERTGNDKIKILILVTQCLDIFHLLFLPPNQHFCNSAGKEDFSHTG